jgi:hypothetical protein
MRMKRVFTVLICFVAVLAGSSSATTQAVSVGAIDSTPCNPNALDDAKAILPWILGRSREKPGEHVYEGGHGEYLERSTARTA